MAWSWPLIEKRRLRILKGVRRRVKRAITSSLHQIIRLVGLFAGIAARKVQPALAGVNDKGPDGGPEAGSGVVVAVATD